MTTTQEALDKLHESIENLRKASNIDKVLENYIATLQRIIDIIEKIGNKEK